MFAIPCIYYENKPFDATEECHCTAVDGAQLPLPDTFSPVVLLDMKVPLTYKIFIAEKGSVLLVEKLRGTLSCKQWLHGEKFEDIVAKICRFVISDVIKTRLSAVCRDVTRGTEVHG